MIDILKERWPELFGTKSQPLALGITPKISSIIGAPEREISSAIAKHCSKPAYLTALASGLPRQDIDGTQTEVSEHHRQKAAQMLVDMAAAHERRIAGKAARRAAERAKKKKTDPIGSIPDLSPKPVVVIKKRRILEKAA